MCIRDRYYTQGSQLYASNFRNQEKWNTTTSTDGMRVSASSKQVAVYSDTQVQCYDASSNLKYAKEFVGAIQSVRCGDTYLAVSYTHLDVYQRQPSITARNRC